VSEVGVPLKRPPLLSVIPAGNIEVVEYVYGPVPPLAVNCWLYESPTVAIGRLAGLIAIPWLTVNVYDALPVALFVSVATTSTVNGDPVSVVGVPLRRPAALSVIPVGKVDVVEYVYVVPAPPLAVSCWL
jgi:hypothetical protein